MKASMLDVGISDSEPFKIRTNLIATGRTCVIGASGSGKSSVVAVLCEELCREKVPFAIIDIEGEYPGLKKAFEAIWIGDGDDADVTWKEVDIEALANVKAEAPPFILDFSRVPNQREKAEAFLREIWRSNSKVRVPYLIIIDEADLIIPNMEKVKTTKDTAKVAKDIAKVAKDIAVRGRRRGLGLLICTQRPSFVSSDVLSQCTNQIIGKLWHENDLQAVKFIIDPKQLKDERMKKGSFWVLGNISPASKGTLVKFRKRETPDWSPQPTMSDNRGVKAPEEIIKKIKRKPRPRALRIDNTLVSEIQTAVARSSKAFSNDRDRIKFLVLKCAEAIPEELSDARSGMTYAEMLLRGLDNDRPIQTMWTIDFGPEMLKKYIRTVLPKEQQAIRKNLRIHRIVNHLDVLDTLRYVALHSRTFAHRDDVTFTLYLPKINQRPPNLQEILLSEQLCPKVEIVVIGDEEASFDAPSIGGMARIHSHTTEPKLVRNAYLRLFEWFCRNGTAINNRYRLLEWIGQLERAIKSLISRLETIPAEEKSRLKRADSLIGAIRRACGSDESLSKKWWNYTAPIYTPRFTSSGDQFLEAYLEEESAVIHRVLEKTNEERKEAPVYIEVGCGAGRVFKNLISKSSNSKPPPIAAMVGVDFSREMLKQCRMTIDTETQRNQGTGVWPVPWALILGDAMRFEKLVGGKPRTLTRRALFSGGNGDMAKDALDKLWVVGLTSILPNLSVHERLKLFRSVYSSLRPGDVLFASTYKSEHFKKVAYDLYNMADVASISGETIITYDEEENTFCSLDEEKGRYFYSHWLSKDELRSLFQKSGPWNATKMWRFEKPPAVAQRELNDPKLQETPYPRCTFISAIKQG